MLQLSKYFHLQMSKRNLARKCKHKRLKIRFFELIIERNSHIFRTGVFGRCKMASEVPGVCTTKPRGRSGRKDRNCNDTTTSRTHVSSTHAPHNCDCTQLPSQTLCHVHVPSHLEKDLISHQHATPRSNKSESGLSQQKCRSKYFH